MLCAGAGFCPPTFPAFQNPGVVGWFSPSLSIGTISQVHGSCGAFNHSNHCKDVPCPLSDHFLAEGLVLDNEPQG